MKANCMQCAKNKPYELLRTGMVGDTFKLKENSFYRKIIIDLVKPKRMTSTANEDLVNQSFRSSFFEDLEEIHGTF